MRNRSKAVKDLRQVARRETAATLNRAKQAGQEIGRAARRAAVSATAQELERLDQEASHQVRRRRLLKAAAVAVALYGVKKLHDTRRSHAGRRRSA